MFNWSAEKLIALLSLCAAMGCHIGPDGPHATPSAQLTESAHITHAAQTTQTALLANSATHIKPAADVIQQTAFAQSATTAAGPVQLTIAEAMQTALEQSPQLIALRAQEAVASAAVDVAHAYPFAPSASTQIDPTPIDANGDDLKTSSQFSVSQTFQLAGQRNLRTRAGTANLDQIRWQIQLGTAQTAAEARRRYYAAYYQAKKTDLYSLLADLNKQLQLLIQHRFEAGQSSAADIAMANMEAATTQQLASLEILKGRTALLDLKSYLQFPPEQSLELVDVAPPTGSLPLPPEAVARGSVDDSTASLAKITMENVPTLASTRPDILAAQAAVAQATAAYELAQANLVPNVQVGPIYSRDESATQFWGLTATVPFGISHTASGTSLVCQRRAELRQRQIELEQKLRQANQELKVAVLGYEFARDAMTQCDMRALQDLNSEVQRVERLFEAGQAELLRVYAARKAVFEFRLSCIDAHLLAAQALTDIQAAAAIVP